MITYYVSEPRRKTSYRNKSLQNIENHVDPPCSTKSNKRSPFVKKEVPLYRERKLRIPTKMIEYIEVNEHSLLTEIVNDFHEDIDPNSPFENCEVFTDPKSLDTPEITLTEKKILQAQEVSFTEISVDQYQVCELEENSNCIVNDIQYVSAVQVFDPFTVKVCFTEEAQQEISNIDHLQSKHDASDLVVSTSTAHKLEHFKKRRDIFQRSDISLATIKNTNSFPLKSGPLALIFFYMSMITILLKFGQAILTRTSLPFCLSCFFFRLKTPVDLSNSDLNFVKWNSFVVSTLG